MITARHIKRFLNNLLDSRDEKQATGTVWQEFHNYIFRYYRWLDNSARAFADDIFDDLDERVKAWIDGFPTGQEKQRLLRKFAMVKGERSPVPILYLDTPVLDAFIRCGLGEKLSVGRLSINGLYEQIRDLVSKARILCPEDTFHRDVLQETGDQFRQGIDMIRSLSDGHCFQHAQTIEDFQVFRALSEFVRGSIPVDYKKFWKDAFSKKTVCAIYDKRSTIALHTGSVLPYGAREPLGGMARDARMKIRYDFDRFSQERQLQKRSARHLRDLVRLGLKYLSMMPDVIEESSGRYVGGFWDRQKMDLPIALWNSFGGSPGGVEGLASFFESDCFRMIPSLKLKREIWNIFSEDEDDGSSRVIGASDMMVVSSVLPYTDMMIMGPKRTRVLRDYLGLDVLFDTEIYCLEEGDRLVEALNKVPNAD